MIAVVTYQIFQPLLGKAGTLREVEHVVNRIGGDLNEKIDSIHDEDHGVRVCNQKAGPESHGVCTITGSKCRALNGRPVGKCRSEWFNPFSTWYGRTFNSQPGIRLPMF